MFISIAAIFILKPSSISSSLCIINENVVNMDYESFSLKLSYFEQK